MAPDPSLDRSSPLAERHLQGPVPSVPTVEARIGPEPGLVAELLEREAGTALAVAAHLLGDRRAASEVLDAAVVEVSGSAPSGALIQATHRRAVDALRRDGAAPHAPVSWTPMSNPTADHAGHGGVGGTDPRSRARAALLALPVELHRIVDLVYFGGLSQADVAARLGLSPGEVAAGTLEAMRCLRSTLLDGAAGRAGPPIPG